MSRVEDLIKYQEERIEALQNEIERLKNELLIQQIKNDENTL